MRARLSSQQRGQAAVEYVVVTLLCVIVLLAATGDDPVIDQLKNAVKTYFSAYSFAISVAPQGP